MSAPNIVNVSSIYGKTVGANLALTLTTDILTCPSGKVLKVNTIIVSNIDGTNSADATVYFYDSSQDTRFALASTIAVPADASIDILEKNSSIYLEEGDQIESGASATDDLQIIVSYEEISDV